MPTSVAFEEIGESPSGRGSRKGDLVFTREFKIAWSDQLVFVQELMFGGLLGLPKQFPGWPAMRVQEVTVSPYIVKPINNSIFYDVETDITQHEFAKVTVSYGPLQAANSNDNLPDGTYAEYEQEESGEFLEVKGDKDDNFSTNLEWLDGTKITDVNATIMVGMTDHTMSWHRVPYPPWAAVSGLKGRVNSVPFRIPATGQWVAPETLLFMGSKCKKTFNTKTASPTWSMTYRFRERVIKTFTSSVTISGGGVFITSAAAAAAVVYGWNHAYRQQTGAWERRFSPSGEPEYASGDFANLFAFEVGFT